MPKITLTLSIDPLAYENAIKILGKGNISKFLNNILLELSATRK